MLRELFFSSYLKENESIYIVIHRHPIIFFKDLIRIIFFGLVLPALLYLFFPQTLIFAALWGWLGFLRLIYWFIDWYYDVWLVTNISIIQIEWQGFFNKSATRTEYHNVESVTYEVKGFIPMLFNYGTIIIEKETGNQIILQDAVSPRKKVEQMLKYQDLFVTQKGLRDHKTLRGLLTDMIHHHFKKSEYPEENED